MKRPIMTIAATSARLAPSTVVDERFMAMAISIARRGLGQTAPNPSVGAVIVRFDRDTPIIVGRGVTAAGGRPHAERIALDQAGELAIGATLYVTLEPCARRSILRDGPSCTEAVLCSGLGRVVIGAEDPSPFAAGEGVKRLRAHGILVESGVLEEEARLITLGHALRVTQRRPMVTAKLAQTADGFVATRDRHPLAITGETANARTHLMRAEADAISVGIGTVLADDPMLTCRLPGLEDRSPVRIIFDTHLRLPLQSKLVRTARTVPVWVFAGLDAPAERERDLVQAGVEVMRVKPVGAGIDLHAGLALLADRGITRLMLEGGPHLANAFAAAGLIDEMALLTGPDASGEGLPALEPHLRDWMERHSADASLPEMLGDDRFDVFGPLMS